VDPNESGVPVRAAIRVDHIASARMAVAAGFVRNGVDGEFEIWQRI